MLITYVKPERPPNNKKEEESPLKRSRKLSSPRKPTPPSGTAPYRGRSHSGKFGRRRKIHKKSHKKSRKKSHKKSRKKSRKIR